MKSGVLESLESVSTSDSDVIILQAEKPVKEVLHFLVIYDSK